MKEAIIKVDLQDDIEPGWCYICPLSSCVDGDAVCKLGWKREECRLQSTSSSNIRVELYSDSEVCFERRVDGRFFVTLFNNDGSFSREIGIGRNDKGKVVSCVR